jgi:hypothetical protein
VNEHEEQRDRSSYWQGEPSPRENAVHRRDASRLPQCLGMTPERRSLGGWTHASLPKNRGRDHHCEGG